MYIVIKAIKGRQHAYEQRSWREGKRVRTESRYLGPVGGTRRPVKRAADIMRAPDPLYRSPPDEEEELLKDVKAQDAAYARMLERTCKEVGFRFNISRDPVPIEKPIPALPAPASTAAPEPRGAAAARGPDAGEKEPLEMRGRRGPPSA